MNRAKTALSLLLAGLLLLPGPVYAVALESLDGSDRHRSSAGYVATPIDVSNDGALAERYAGDVAFRTSSLRYRHVAEAYRAPNRTRDALERAFRRPNATVGVTDSDVRADLRAIDEAFPFVTVEYDAYADLRLSTPAGGDGRATTVRAVRANESAVAAAVRRELVVPFEALSAGERRTFEKIRNATESSEAYDYRPWSDEAVVGPPAIVERDGEHYAVRVASHTDDFGFPDGFFVGLVASVLGVVSLLAAGGVALVGRSPDD